MSAYRGEVVRRVRIGVAAASVPLVASFLTAATAASASTAAATQRVTYQGYTFQVPGSWPVINLAASPQTCVQFDRHAVYLGVPGSEENCPAGAVGKPTEALLIQPAAAQAAVTSVQNAAAQTDTVTDARIQVTASYGTDPGLVAQILASAKLPAPAAAPPPAPAVPSPTTQAPASPGTASENAVSPNAVPASATSPGVTTITTSDSGLGFDTCAAPSTSAMNAWRRDSPYRAVGVYIGGPDMACYQANLTASWVRNQAAAGWTFLPVYEGPQAEFGELSSPASQGVTSARAAVSEAERLGIKPGATLYDDMEAFPGSQNGNVIAFETAWTAELHLYQYQSGVYSSSGAGIGPLARTFSTPSPDAPDVVWDALWNNQANTSDSNIPASAWPYRQRVHQYAGAVWQSYGGVEMNIDKDYLNTVQPYDKAVPAVTVDSAGTIRVFTRAPDRSLRTESMTPQGKWSGWANLAGDWTADPAVVSLPGGKVFVFGVDNNTNLYVDTLSGGKWSGWDELGSHFQGTPAVVDSGGAIRVFARGLNGAVYADNRSSGGQWSGLVNLGGNWSNDVSAVAESNGNTEVFVVGSNGSLYADTYNGTRASGWGRIGGELEGVAAAVQDHTGTVRVYVRASDGVMYMNSQKPGGRWSGFARMGGSWQGNPAAFVASTGTVWVFSTGVNGALFYDELPPSKNYLGWRSIRGSITGTPAVVQQASNNVISVYARGTGGNLEEYASPKWTRGSRGGSLY
jgi:hypothetical protein